MPSGIRTVDNSRPPTTKNTPGSRKSIVCGKAPQLDEGVGQLVEAASDLARSSPGGGLGGVIQIGQDNDRDEGEECSPQSGREQVDLHGHSREDADLLVEGRGPEVDREQETPTQVARLSLGSTPGGRFLEYHLAGCSA
jgi:hypothetical protein